jgi:hypothetical protein
LREDNPEEVDADNRETSRQVQSTHSTIQFRYMAATLNRNYPTRKRPDFNTHRLLRLGKQKVKRFSFLDDT